MGRPYRGGHEVHPGSAYHNVTISMSPSQQRQLLLEIDRRRARGELGNQATVSQIVRDALAAYLPPEQKETTDARP